MFTGIIDHCGKVLKVEELKAGRRITINSQFNDLAQGESIAVDGACLTVAGVTGQQFYCDLSPETLNLTNFCQLELQDQVNLERSLRLSDRLGGHFVSGHVDQTAIVVLSNRQDEFLQLVIGNILPEQQSLLIAKGSVCVNGVSLTINRLTDDGFELMLIPETLSRTNLAQLNVDDSVNIEFDMLAKMIHQQLVHWADPTIVTTGSKA